MKNALKIQWKACSLPKLGNSPAENEDAFSPEIEQQSFTAQTPFACAVADGATQTSFSRLWARLLVAEAARNFQPERLPELIAAAQAKWLGYTASVELPWHAEEKVRQGAFATLLWMNIQPPSARSTKNTGAWHALAIGDTCLFQIRKKTLRAQFPTLSTADFNNHPWLLSTNPGRNTGFWNSLDDLRTSGDWAAGDDFLLMTDALAAWFVHEQAKTPLSRLLPRLLSVLTSTAEFSFWLKRLREDADIKNDDTTIVWIHLEN